MRATGDCFQANGRAFMRRIDAGARNVVLVHGEVTGKGRIEGVKHGHAWIEESIGGAVFVRSFANGGDLFVDRDSYYELGRIGENVHRYDAAAFRQRVLEHGHWGPWDLVTSTGL